MANVIVKKYEHYNKAFKNWDCDRGRYISSKADYDKAMAEEGMISEKEARSQGLQEQKAKRVDYKLSREMRNLIEAVKQTKDSKGKIHPSGRQKKMLMDKFKYNKQTMKDMGL